MTLGKRIKLAREARDISQGALAKLVGKERPSVSMWEAGRTVPRLPVLKQLAQALMVEEGWLLNGTGKGPGEMAPSKLSDNNQPGEQNIQSRQNITWQQPSEARIDAPQPIRLGHTADMPVFAGAEGGVGELIIHSEPVDYISRPQNLEHVKEAFGVIVTGGSMVPAYKPGETALVNPRQAPAPGDDCILISHSEETGERRGLIKEFVRATATHWIVRQHADTEYAKGGQEISLPKAEWQLAYKVTGKFTR